MKKISARILSLILIGLIIGASVFSVTNYTFAEEGSEEMQSFTNISISPVSKIFQLDPDSEYHETLEVTNNSDNTAEFEVYAAPYSYVQSEDTGDYALGFSQENSYTQIVRWITVKDPSGSYVEKANFVAEPKETISVEYRVKTPHDIPSGGQYAVLFAHALAGGGGSGIKTEASPGMVIYGRSNGETVLAPEINDLAINKTLEKYDTSENGSQSANGTVTVSHINASAKIKNNGNVDFTAKGVLKVEDLFGTVCYETPEGGARISVIPEVELALADEWVDTPGFGIYRVSWTVTAGEEVQTIETTMFIVSPFIVIFSIILLTIAIVLIIIAIRKRKEHRSRLAI